MGIQKKAVQDLLASMNMCDELDNDTYIKLSSRIENMDDTGIAEWIPVKWREPTKEEKRHYEFMADCPMPDEGQEILITRKYVSRRTGKKEYFVEMDTCLFDDGYYLDSGEEWKDIVAWAPKPEPYTEEEG